MRGGGPGGRAPPFIADTASMRELPAPGEKGTGGYCCCCPARAVATGLGEVGNASSTSPRVDELRLADTFFLLPRRPPFFLPPVATTTAMARTKSTPPPTPSPM